MMSKKSVCIITGASRGLGESIALNFASKFPEGSVFILLARSKPSLENVQRRIHEISPNVRAVAKVYDQGAVENQIFDTILADALVKADVRTSDFEQAMLINNAASIEPTLYIRSLPGVEEISNYFNVNIAGTIALTSSFIKLFPATSGVSRVVINISSLCAVQPIKSLSLYCAGKAARDMFFKVLAEEEENVRVLNYAPGPLATDMMDTLIRSSEDEGLRHTMGDMKTKDTILLCDTSVQKLLQVLEKGTFESGLHLDYYDI